MQRLTLEQAIVLTGYTGVLMCPFSEFHADVERRLEIPFWIHEFADNKEYLKEVYKEDFLKLCVMD